MIWYNPVCLVFHIQLESSNRTILLPGDTLAKKNYHCEIWDITHIPRLGK